MKGFLSILLAFLCCAVSAPAGADRGERIEDNSFLIEEAYNQEPGVIQHVSAFQRSLGAGGWLYTFTEEWPAWGQDHQLSATIPLGRVGSGPATSTGIGDLQLHYRYALRREEHTATAAVVRLSLLLPTGDAAKGLGSGGVGMQVNLPLSVGLGERFVTHWNAGGTYFPAARSDSGSGRVTGYAVGQSLVWLARPSFNLMLEALWTETETATAAGTKRAAALTLSPGFRMAADFSGGLQVVWGLGVPLGLGPTRGDNGLLLYLSFEHPLGARGGREARGGGEANEKDQAAARSP